LVTGLADDSNYKWFDEPKNHYLGQTFTPSATATLTSFTIHLRSLNADDGPDTANFRLGTITRPGGVFTFTDIITPEASPQNGDWAALDYVTYTLDTPTALTGGVEYGVILDMQDAGNWSNGIPYSWRSGDNVAGGVGIYGGDDGGTAESGIAAAEKVGQDLVFHANLAVPEPSTFALLGLSGLALILRRRRK